MELIIKVLNWIKLLLIKCFQILRYTLSMLRPEKTFTSKLCFSMALVCTLIYMFNAGWTVLNACFIILENTEGTALSNIALAKTICEKAEESQDTVTTTKLYTMLHEGGIDDDFYMCLTDSDMHIVSSTDTTWVGDSITSLMNAQGIGIFADKKSTLSMFRGELYQFLSDDVDGFGYDIVLMKPASVMFAPIVTLAFKIGKSSFYCLLLLILCYLVMLYFLRRSSSQNKQIESEMEIAAKLQNQMIPQDFSAFPEPHGYDLHGLLVPAKSIGGDIFDYVLKGNKLFFCLGDVSGKGTHAALFMSEVHILFRHILTNTLDPADIAQAMSNTLTQGNESNMFCTTFIGVLDLESHILKYCNAGHNPSVFISPEGKAEFLDVQPNLALGLFEDFPFVTQEMEFLPNSSLFCYTDGITEAENLEKKVFGDSNVLEALTNTQYYAPSDICQQMLSRVQSHAMMAEQSDDITMLCLKRNRI